MTKKQKLNVQIEVNLKDLSKSHSRIDYKTYSQRQKVYSVLCEPKKLYA